MIPRGAFHLLAAFLLAAVLGIPTTARAETADAAWQAVLHLQQEAAAPAPHGINEVDFYAPRETELHDAAAAFAEGHPDDLRRWEADLIAIKNQQFPAAAETRRAIFDHNEAILRTILAAADASPKIKQDSERALIRQHLDHLDLITSPAQAAEMEKRLADYLRRFPTDPKAANMEVRRIDLWQRVDPDKAAALRDEMSASPDPKISAAARGRQAQSTLGTAALDWKLPALDGSTIDLPSLQGKLVLVQFWASWCPDCAREMPAVLKAYRQFHGRGLEIVGVSLDKDKDALEATVRKKGITWPQFYDGKGWENDVAVRYGVRGIPELWLVNTEGRVVATGIEVDQLAALIPPLLPAR